MRYTNLLLLLLLLLAGCHDRKGGNAGMSNTGRDTAAFSDNPSASMHEPAGDEWARFIAPCYAAERIIRGGDLNGDGVADAVLICLRKISADCGAPADSNEAFERPRTLSVLSGRRAGGYTLFATGKELPSIRAGSEDVLDSVAVTPRGTLQIALHYEVSLMKGSTIFTFRCQDGAFELIGLNIDEGNAESFDTYDYNLSTGQYTYSVDLNEPGETAWKEEGKGVLKMRRPRLFGPDAEGGFGLQLMANEVEEAIQKHANAIRTSHETQ